MPPRQLPGRTAPFVGRAAELAALDGLLQHADTAPGMVVISAIAGTAGIGKTALALHWAHLVADRFPDGQLYVNLRGFDPAGHPVTPATALRGFLDALGVPPEQVPAGPDAQAGLYRGLLAGKRMLIVLDNALDAGQVRPLLPASPGCLVLVTSRSQLTDLVAVDGAALLSLDVLGQAEALDLLAARLGPTRLAAEPGAARELTGLCARLPLALCITAARAAAHPRFSLASLVSELQDTASRLDALAAGDGPSSIRAVFSWSYHQLKPTPARMFRLLGLHPGPDITAAAAASLAAIPPAQARAALAELTRASLLAEDTPGRYAFHDLLRAYAAELAETDDTPAERQAAVRRALDHYLHTSRAASQVFSPPAVVIAVDPPGPGVLPEDIVGDEQAVAWLEAEHQVLLAAVSQAAQAGLDTYAWQLPAALVSHLDLRGRWDTALALLKIALAAAQRLGDLTAQALTRNYLGHAHTVLGSYPDGYAHLNAALGQFGQLGDSKGQALAHLTLAMLAVRQGQFSDTLGHLQQALGLCQATSDRNMQAGLLNNLGWTHAQTGDYEQALDCCQQALTMAGEVGNRSTQADALDSLGFIRQHLGQYDDAIACYQQALALNRTIGNRRHQATNLTGLGDACHAAGRPQDARQAWQEALDILEDLRDPAAGKVRERLTSAAAP